VGTHVLKVKNVGTVELNVQPTQTHAGHQGRTQAYGHLGHGPGHRPKKKLELLRSVVAHRQTLKTNPSHVPSRTPVLARPVMRDAPCSCEPAACGSPRPLSACQATRHAPSRLRLRLAAHQSPRPTPARPALARHSLFMV
jgi:hypothetical protein